MLQEMQLQESGSDVVFFYLAPQGGAVHAQGPGSFLSLPAVFLQSFHYPLPFPLIPAGSNIRPGDAFSLPVTTDCLKIQG